MVTKFEGFSGVIIFSYVLSFHQREILMFLSLFINFLLACQLVSLLSSIFLGSLIECGARVNSCEQFDFVTL